MADYLGRIAWKFKDVVQAGKVGAGKGNFFSRKMFKLECAYKSPNSDSVGLGCVLKCSISKKLPGSSASGLSTTLHSKILDCNLCPLQPPFPWRRV